MILVGSASSKVHAWCRQDLCEFGSALSVSDYASLAESLFRLVPQVLLLDLSLPGMNGYRGVESLRTLNLSAKVVILCHDASDDIELALFRTGSVRGCIRMGEPLPDLKRIVTSVQRGELWMRRSLTLRMLEESGTRGREQAQPRRVPSGRQIRLTQREREIAALVGDGYSNKQIAPMPDIGERTVKARSTGIFRKLGIADRLTLALRMMSPEPENQETVA